MALELTTDNEAKALKCLLANNPSNEAGVCGSDENTMKRLQRKLHGATVEEVHALIHTMEKDHIIEFTNLSSNEFTYDVHFLESLRCLVSLPAQITKLLWRKVSAARLIFADEDDFVLAAVEVHSLCFEWNSVLRADGVAVMPINQCAILGNDKSITATVSNDVFFQLLESLWRRRRDKIFKSFVNFNVHICSSFCNPSHLYSRFQLYIDRRAPWYTTCLVFYKISRISLDYLLTVAKMSIIIDR